MGEHPPPLSHLPPPPVPHPAEPTTHLRLRDLRQQQQGLRDVGRVGRVGLQLLVHGLQGQHLRLQGLWKGRGAFGARRRRAGEQRGVDGVDGVQGEGSKRGGRALSFACSPSDLHYEIRIHPTRTHTHTLACMHTHTHSHTLLRACTHMCRHKHTCMHLGVQPPLQESARQSCDTFHVELSLRRLWCEGWMQMPRDAVQCRPVVRQGCAAWRTS